MPGCVRGGLKSRPTSNLVLAVAVMLACGGCGGARSAVGTPANSRVENSTGDGPKPVSGQPRLDMRLRSPISLHPISAMYTCDGSDVSPPLHWTKVPRNVAEFDVVVVNATDVDGKLWAYWGVAGLSADVNTLSPGRIPRNAIVGRNSFGHESYQLCPSVDTGSQYVILLFAPTRRVSLSPGFDVARLAERFLHTNVSDALLVFSYHFG
jgi:phosphatidylethanolamine-binding protein (PEBP) family uncharacterized protein